MVNDITVLNFDIGRSEVVSESFLVIMKVVAVEKDEEITLLL